MYLQTGDKAMCLNDFNPLFFITSLSHEHLNFPISVAIVPPMHFDVGLCSQTLSPLCRQRMYNSSMLFTKHVIAGRAIKRIYAPLFNRGRACLAVSFGNYEELTISSPPRATVII